MDKIFNIWSYYTCHVINITKRTYKIHVQTKTKGHYQHLGSNQWIEIHNEYLSYEAHWEPHNFNKS